MNQLPSLALLRSPVPSWLDAELESESLPWDAFRRRIRFLCGSSNLEIIIIILIFIIIILRLLQPVVGLRLVPNGHGHNDEAKNGEPAANADEDVSQLLRV